MLSIIVHVGSNTNVDIMCFNRVQKEHLAFSPLLPTDISELCIRGVNYLGHQMDWLLRKDDVCIILREQTGRPVNAKLCDLQVVLKASGTTIPLTPGNTQAKKHLYEEPTSRLIVIFDMKIIWLCIEYAVTDCYY